VERTGARLPAGGLQDAAGPHGPQGAAGPRGFRGAAPARRAKWIYLPPALLLAAWAIRLAAADRPSSVLDLLNLAFHEAGHLFLSPFGQTLHVLGGTLMQLFVPALLAGYFLLKRGPFSATVCLWWLGQSFVNVSVYMADAREMKLDLVGGGEHDWTQIFYQFGLLGEESVRAVSTLTHHFGVLVMLASAAFIASFSLIPGARERFRDWLERRLGGSSPGPA
jgi:hypothetical protein